MQPKELISDLEISALLLERVARRQEARARAARELAGELRREASLIRIELAQLNRPVVRHT